MMTKSHHLKIFISYFCLCALLYTPAVTAGTFQSHKSIHQAARNFISNHVASQHEQRPEIKIGKLDARLKLKQCNKKLRAFLPKGGREIGKTTIGVKCTGSKPWSLYVPVTISVYRNVLVLARQMQKGTVLTASDIKLAKRNLGRLSYGYFENLKSGIGMKLKRRAATGAVLTPAMLKKPQIIARGQKITIMAQSGSMQVRMNGKALASGAIGDRIKVMNMKSRKKLEGIITLTGEVKVDI
jgi:flagellar basal body P-ring formation protein FlgA